MHKRNDIHCPAAGADHVTRWRRGEFENARKFNTSLYDITLYNTMHDNHPSKNTTLTIVIATATPPGIAAAAAAFPSTHDAGPIDAHECVHGH